METAKAFADSPGHKEHENQVTALTKKHKNVSAVASCQIIAV